MTGTAIFTEVDAESGVATVRFERPPANGLDPGVVEELDTARRVLEDDARVRAVLLTSGVKGMFSAGADARWVADGCRRVGADAFAAKFRDFTAAFTACCDAIEDSRVVWTAEIAGACVAGGLELALACDVRIAAEDRARFAFPELAMFGAPPTGGGALQRLVRAVGRSKTLELVAGGNRFGSAEALAWGLVDGVAPVEAVHTRARALCERFAEPNVAAGMRALKRGIAAASLPLHEARRRDRALFEERLAAPEFAAGLASFAKRFGGG